LLTEFVFGSVMQATRLIVPEVALSRDTLEVVLSRLHESHDLSAYEAVDRLVHAGEEAGLATDTLLRMLDRGMSLQELLELIVSKANPISDITQMESKRSFEPSPPSHADKDLELVA
jgi:hypothetical protein